MVTLSRPKSAVVLLVLPPLLVVGVMARAVRARMIEGQSPEAKWVDAPSSWVAFSADVTISHPGSEPILGRFYRASTGSYRTQTGPTRAEAKVIHIVNTSEGFSYLYNQEGWTSWQIANIELRPRHFLKNREWSDYPHHLALKRGESNSLTANEGFEAYLVTGRGVTKLRVPELNLFAVVRQRIDGRHEAYTNIDLTEPPADLFRPPSGVSVKFKSLSAASPTR